MLLVQPTPEQQVHIRKVLNDNPETRENDLETIKEWLKSQPHLPDTWDEDCLLTFLRGCEFSLDVCKNKLDKYFTFRSTMPEFFTNRDIKTSELQKIAEIFDGVVLPDLTPDGKRISIAKAAKMDFETPNVADVVKIVFMVGDLRLKFEETGVMGDVYVLDAGFPLAKHFLRTNPLTLKKMFTCVQDAYPVRIKEIHVINAPAFVEFVIAVIKPFLSEALRKTILVHTDIATLYDFIPRDILPEEYGGKAGKLGDLKNRWMKTLEEYGNWLKKQEDIKADESKRPNTGSFFWNPFGFWK